MQVRAFDRYITLNEKRNMVQLGLHVVFLNQHIPCDVKYAVVLNLNNQ